MICEHCDINAKLYEQGLVAVDNEKFAKVLDKLDKIADEMQSDAHNYDVYYLSSALASYAYELRNIVKELEAL